MNEADARLGIRSRFDLPNVVGDESVIVLDGDREVTGVPLDFFALDTWAGFDAGLHAAAGLIVEGDLTVAMTVANLVADFGPFLLVLGGLRAQNFVTSGSEVLVEGDLAAVQTVYGFGNHGSTIVLGDTSAEVVIAEQHLMAFHGALHADVLAAGNFVRIADPGRFAAAEWTGSVASLDGEPLTVLGKESERALRRLDPLYWHLDRKAIIAAAETGTSLLRRARPRTPRPKGPVSEVDAVRFALLEGGCPEHGRFDDGFSASRRGRHVEVWVCEADVPDDEAEPYDEEAALRTCANVLTAAGFEFEADWSDAVLSVRRT